MEINDHQYRYEYEPDTKATRYLGPVGSAPPLSEGEFYKRMQFDLPKHTFIHGIDRDGKARKWAIRTEHLRARLDKMGLGWNEGKPTEDRNRKALYDTILGSKYGNGWEANYVFIDPGELMDGENFIDPMVLSGPRKGGKFEMCEVLYSASVKKKPEEELGGFFLPPIQEEEVSMKPVLVAFTRTRRGIPFYIIGQHTLTKYEPPIQYSYKQTDSFKLWLVVERHLVDDFFEELRALYTWDNPARAIPVTLDLLKFRDEIVTPFE